MEIISSTNQRPSHLKLLFWGDTGTRKTESILRNFPDVLMIDTEGNAEQCFGMPDIPEFMLARTKDLDEIIKLIDEVHAGRVKFPNGRAVQTLAIDSITVLWTIRKDVRAVVAEGRAARWGKSAEEATMTQLDWSMAKRPIVRLMTSMANSPVKYIVLTARQNDKFEDDPKKKGEMVKTGVKADAIKGLEYDMNLVLQMAGTGTEWSCVVTKVQGALGKSLAMGKRMTAFPAEVILKHAGGIVPVTRSEPDESELVDKAAKEESGADTISMQAPVKQAETTQANDLKAQVDAALAEIGAGSDDVKRVLGAERISVWLAKDGHTVDNLKSLVLDGMVGAAK